MKTAQTCNTCLESKCEVRAICEDNAAPIEETEQVTLTEVS